ncbi:hypothetical protein DL96DRAFT_1586301 [Flagelloscypha sp. PMI_526]|nr:hypothetical protein DL96DRAFT_1586301 [Flagelloscypha sp. PMI_526]
MPSKPVPSSNSQQPSKASKKPAPKGNKQNKRNRQEPSKPKSQKSPQDEVQAARSAIDEEIVELRGRFERELQVLKTRRNLLAPFATLPPELLCQIFAIFKPRPFEHRAVHDMSSGVKPLVVLTHVCRHWRDSAIGFAELWTAPVLTSSIATAEMLRRSKDASLDVWCDFPASLGNTKHFKTLMSCLENLSKVAQLHIGHMPSRPSDDDLITKKLRSPAHTMKCSEISFHTTQEGTGLRSDFLGGHAPLLRILSLRGAGVPWDSTILGPMITSLRMGSLAAVLRAPLDTVLNALETMAPSLQSLELSEESLPLVPDGGSDARQVSLHYLRHLTLQGCFNRCLELVTWLVLPESTTYSIDSRRLSPTALGGVLSFKAAFPLLSQVCSKPVKQLQVITGDRRFMEFDDLQPPEAGVCLQVTLHDAEMSILDLPGALGIPIQRPSIFLGLPTSSLLDVSQVDAVQQSFAQMDLRRLMLLDLDVPLSETVWLSTFSKLPSLKEICLFRDASDTFIKALKRDINSWPKHTSVATSNPKPNKRKQKRKGEQPQPQPPQASSSSAPAPIVPSFPALAELSIIDSDFPRNVPPTSKFSFAQNIKFVVQRRTQLPGSKGKYRLKRLTIQGCEMSYSDEQSLDECKKYVDLVDIDYVGLPDEFGYGMGSDDDNIWDDDMEAFYDDHSRWTEDYTGGGIGFDDGFWY